MMNESVSTAIRKASFNTNITDLVVRTFSENFPTVLLKFPRNGEQWETVIRIVGDWDCQYTVDGKTAYLDIEFDNLPKGVSDVKQ